MSCRFFVPGCVQSVKSGKAIDNRQVMRYNVSVNLIKSGGGTGPMKPGNRLQQRKNGAKSCGIYREMRNSRTRNEIAHSSDGCVFLWMYERNDENESLFVYV